MTWERPIDATVVRAADREPVRADLLMTLFLGDPEAYDGGELVIVAETGTQRIKLAAGSAVVYPATNYHRVEAVSGGERWTAETVIQSVVRDDEERKVLAEIGTVLDWIGGAPPEAAERLATSRRALRRARANLYRMWADL
jgi:PKHD-type hydroxylase